MNCGFCNRCRLQRLTIAVAVICVVIEGEGPCRLCHLLVLHLGVVLSILIVWIRAVASAFVLIVWIVAKTCIVNWLYGLEPKLHLANSVSREEYIFRRCE